MPYIGNNIRSADDYRLIDDVSSNFDGSTTSFPLQVSGASPSPFPKSPQQVLISVNGVIQEPDPTGSAGFNLVGNNIVFSSAPANGQAFFGIIYATADYLNVGGTFPAGASNLPSITFSADTDTGLYRKTSGTVGFVSDGTEVGSFDSNGINSNSINVTGTVSSGSIDVTGTVSSNAINTTGDISIDNEKELRLFEADASGSNYIAIKAPSSLSSNTTFTLPEDGTADQVLKTNGNGVLSFADASGGGGLTGPSTQQLFIETDNVMNNNFTTGANKNYLNLLPLTINATLTVTDGSFMHFISD